MKHRIGLYQRLSSLEKHLSRIEGEITTYGSVLSAIVALLSLLYLRGIAGGFPETPRIFPLTVIRIAIPIAAALVIKEVVTTFYRPDLFGDVDDKVTEHLKGAESRFSVGERAKRLAITGVVTVGFFAIATLNVLAAVVVIYPAAVYALGVRDRRAIATSTALLVGFVYLVFVVIIEMPLDLF